MIGGETFSDDFYLMLQKDVLRYLDLTHSLTEIRDKSVFYSQIQVGKLPKLSNKVATQIYLWNNDC